MNRYCSSLSFCALILISAAAAVAQDYKPEIAKASGDAKLALEGFVIPEGMTGSLLAAEPDIANPVAFFPAHDGRVFVCETFRQEIGVEDNRNHMNWLQNDLRLQSVEERLAMYRQYLGHDIEKFATQHDRIRVLEDTNGDGRFDKDTVFAEGFNDVLEGTGAGVLEHNGRVYYTCIPKLWSLQDTDNDSVADEMQALHHGYGVRVAFRGHDMHGLVVGPDGRLYFSIGDRGYNVINQEGERLHRPDTGAIFRCDMDGSHLEVFAYGLRNPQELAFDDNGNLWTCDNNSDSEDLSRWVYAVQDGDTGWRMYYQYLEDRGPWNRERMWDPYRKDEHTTAVQPAYIVPPIANISDGPSGLTYYPGIGLSERYRNHFFLADFRGTAGISGIRSFSVKPRGATFELTDAHQFIWSILCTDVDFAPDGSLYVTDWVNGWVGEGKGRLYRFVDDANITAVAGANVAELLDGGLRAAADDDLGQYLSHADRRVRQAAQFEVVARPALHDRLFASEAWPDDDLTQCHVARALWQLGLKSRAQARRFVRICATGAVSTEGERGVTYTKILTDLVRRHGLEDIVSGAQRKSLRELLTGLTGSADLRQAGFAAVALGQIGQAEDVVTLLGLLHRNNDDDPVLRHQAVMGLVRIGRRNPDALNQVDRGKAPPAVRLGLVLALRRLERQEVAAFLDDSDASVAAEAARAVAEFGPDSTLNKLAFPLLVPVGHPKAVTDSVVVRRSLEAAYRLGGARHALAVARVAGDRGRSDDIRLVAARMLTSWNTPQKTDTVTGKWRPLPNREVENLSNAVQADLPGMLAGAPDLQTQAARLAAQLGIKSVVPKLQQLLTDDDARDSVQVSAFHALTKLTDDIDGLVADGQQHAVEAVRLAALEFVTRTNPTAAMDQLRQTVKSGSVPAKQRAFRLLGEISGPATATAATVLADALTELNAGRLGKAVVLDLLMAAEAHGSQDLKSLVKAFRDKQAASGKKLDAWSDCLEGGNADTGKVIFFGRAAASCRRCHKVNGDGADVGPDLSAVAKDKDRTYLLEAIVDPNVKIAKGFETTIIVDFDGRIHSGIIKEETDKVVRLMDPRGGVKTIAVDEIDERAKGQSGMPADIARNMTRSEIRDLVAYLATLKVATKAGAHGEGGE